MGLAVKTIDSAYQVRDCSVEKNEKSVLLGRTFNTMYPLRPKIMMSLETGGNGTNEAHTLEIKSYNKRITGRSY